jgi:hypothetical protein
MLLGFQTVLAAVYSGIDIKRDSICFEQNKKCVIQGRLKHLKRILAMLLLVLWAPTTSHCMIESAGLLPAFLCCDEACGGEADQDACKALESAAYKVDERDSPVAMSVVLFLLPQVLSDLNDGVEPAPAPGFYPQGAPELAVTWQFSSRTALPPRAPSLAS